MHFRYSTTAGIVVAASTLVAILPVAAAPSHLKRVHGDHSSFGIAPSSTTRLGSNHAGRHLAALVGDRESGLGFYALPERYRRAHVVEDHRGDAIRYAIATEAGYGYYYGIGGEEGAGGSHHHTLFNPVDGYGSPFFAGYYGSARDDDSEPGPFGGTPYKD